MRILAFDIGSSSTRAAIFSSNGRRSEMVAQHYAFRPDCDAELSPAVLLKAARESFARLGRSRFDAIAACAFWHGLLGIDERLRAITPIYTWADARSAVAAAGLRKELDERRILQRTGCMLRFPFWPAKLRWLRKERPQLFRRVAFWVSPADWIMARLFGQLATSESLASGTGLFDYGCRRWDHSLCDAAGIASSQLPAIASSLWGGEILTPIGDGAAGNLGSRAKRHVLAINLGTSAAARLTVQRDGVEPIPLGLFRYIIDDRRAVLGGAISNAGNVHAWCEKAFGRQRLSRRSSAANPLTALPFLFPERSPDWPELPAAIYGLHAQTNKGQIHESLVVAALYRLAEVVDRIGSVSSIRHIVVSGGMSRGRDIVQILADVLGRNLEIAKQGEASLRGAAAYGLRQLGQGLAEPKPGRIIRFDRLLAQQHRVRRRKQRQLLLGLTRSR